LPNFSDEKKQLSFTPFPTFKFDFLGSREFHEMKRVSWWLFIVSILHKNISKSTKSKITQFDFEFLNHFFDIWS
jgi:hypothetical protein